MSAEQMLKQYISSHPEYWEFENETKEVERLISLCNPTANQPFLAQAHS